MPLDLQPTLENDLVILRPLDLKDYTSLYQIASDPLIWVQHPCSDRYKEDVFKVFFADSLNSKGALIVVNKMTNQAIGSTRFKRINGVDNAIEIGWTFLSRIYWGGQYNKSIKYLMCTYAFKAIDDIVFYIDKQNIRSQKAVEKLGGIRIISPEFSQLISNNKSNLTYRISKTEWKL